MSSYLIKKKIKERQKRNLAINISLLIACFVLFVLNIFVVNANKDLVHYLSISTQEVRRLERKNEVLSLKISSFSQLDKLTQMMRENSFSSPEFITWLKIQPGILVERLAGK